ncbi:MAG: chromosome segregation protein ScpA [Gemmataceae bacterium]|nr:chromosome segregation protein ScpA [Gemmataceae bacterium]
METSAYRVDIDSFHGPMDLLLHLVKKNEVDILDIPIAQIAEQFKVHLEVLAVLDMNGAGDFLVLATRLMEIKSAMLLPRPVEVEEEKADPRNELIKQLVEYKKYKEAAALLEEKAEEANQKLPRLPGGTDGFSASRLEKPIQQVELWDLVSAFGRLMRETLATQPQDIVMDVTPMEVYVEEISSRLRLHKVLPFRDLFQPPYQKMRLIGLFLALLELIKKQSILADQRSGFGEIQVRWVQHAAIF